MTPCFFVTDLHGAVDRYDKLFSMIERDRPEAVFMGGDLLVSGAHFMAQKTGAPADSISEYMQPKFKTLRRRMGRDFPRVFLIMGNDDYRSEEPDIIAGEEMGLWVYLHMRSMTFQGYRLFGYSFVPPTPFQGKDWERYDVSRYVDPGCVSPEKGLRTVPVSMQEIRYTTIAEDLEDLAGESDLAKSVFLFHAPPYRTNLDRAALDGKMIDHVPLDVNVGSIAVKNFIENRQPMLTLHGHIHESARLTGAWRDRIRNTHCFSAAHDGPELALVRFDLGDPAGATRELI